MVFTSALEGPLSNGVPLETVPFTWPSGPFAPSVSVHLHVRHLLPIRLVPSNDPSLTLLDPISGRFFTIYPLAGWVIVIITPCSSPEFVSTFLSNSKWTKPFLAERQAEYPLDCAVATSFPFETITLVRAQPCPLACARPVTLHVYPCRSSPRLLLLVVN